MAADKLGHGVMLKGLETLPIQIPRDILDAQNHLGVDATLLWINLLAIAQQGKPIQIGAMADYMGLAKQQVEKALVILADQGWINDEGLEIKLMVPQRLKLNNTKPPAVLDESQASFEWLVTFWTNRVGTPSAAEMRKLLFWVEKKGLSEEVIAVAIEEMCASADSPSFSYLEGILRNWYNEGVRHYGDLVDRSHLAKVLNGPKEHAIHPVARNKWKEVFPDEFD